LLPRFSKNARLGDTIPVRHSVRSTSRLLCSASSPTTMHAMSGVMCSMIPARRSIGFIVGPLRTPTLRYSGSAIT